MPPEASSLPERSVYGPGGATITLNSLVGARWTSTLRPLGSPAICSIAHRPLTVVAASSRLRLQDRVQSVEHRHPPRQQLAVVRRRLRESPDGEVHAGRLVACELAVVQVGLVNDL